MIYTHLNLSFLPIFISFFLFLLFFFLGLLFEIFVTFFIKIFFLLFLLMLFFLYFYSDSLLEFSYIQFYLNSQFFIYFVVSEVFFFIGVFWGLFWIIFSYDSCFLLSISLINPFGLALFNTFLLLLSSTFGILHHLNYLNFFKDLNLLVCILLGLFFLINQYLEFNFCFYTISDYSFCSIFFFWYRFSWFSCFCWFDFITIKLCLL